MSTLAPNISEIYSISIYQNCFFISNFWAPVLKLQLNEHFTVQRRKFFSHLLTSQPMNKKVRCYTSHYYIVLPFCDIFHKPELVQPIKKRVTTRYRFVTRSMRALLSRASALHFGHR